jgi:hypothetical protein
MDLTTPQRIGAYFAGFGLGCIMVSVILTLRGLPHAPEPPPPGVIRREVPGMLSQWMQSHLPILGDFVLSQSDDLHTPNRDPAFRTRCVVVTGLDPGAFIRIEERSTLANLDEVTDWKFMFADHVRVKLVSPDASHALVDAMRPFGWHFLGDQNPDGWIGIMLDGHDVRSVPAAVDKLKSWPQWVAVAEPDYLPAPSNEGWHGL